MCGRFTLRTPQTQLLVEFGVDALPLLAPRFNIAPTQPILAIRWDPGGGQRTAALLRWGLVPSWADDPKIGNRMINARGETVAEKPAFRTAFKRRRCLIPADGYYEWKADGKRKQPYLIHLRDNGPFGMAGLWESWSPGDGSTLETCTIITTEGNELTRPIHDRMPVVIEPADYGLWLNPDTPSPALLALIHPRTPLDMDLYPVSTVVNSPMNERADCVERVS